jgi:uncharacterized Zn finger protein (UPF0148 family)
MIKSKLFEVEQPQSEGEKNFKALHRAVNHKNLVPGITDQDHIFNGSTKPYDNKHNVGYKPGEDRAAYDKTLKLHDKETDNGYETARVEEQIGSMIGKTHNDIRNTASFGSSKVSGMIRKEKQRKAAEAAAASMKKEEIEQVYEKNWIKDAVGKPGALTMAAKRAGMSNAEYEKKHMHDSGVAGKRSRLAMTLKNLHKEEIESLDEAKWMEKDLPGRNYNKDGYSEKGDLHHIEVHPELLKKHAIIHQVTHDGEYGPTHHFEHPSHGKVAVYQSGLNKKSGNPIISVRTYGKKGVKPVADKFASMLKGKTMHVYNESVNENYDDTPEEVSMVRTELKAIVADAQSLLDNMPSDMHIEPWVQSKIAVAKSMVNGVHDYMLYSDDDDKPSDMRSPMPSMSNPFSTNEENDLDEKLSPEKLKKFAKLAPPYDKITYADKIVAVKKKEAGQKVLPEASMLGRECTACGEGHYKEIDGKMCCNECGNVAKNEMKEASVIKSHAMHMARQTMRRLKPEMKHTMHTKMNTPKDKLNMNKGDK